MPINDICRTNESVADEFPTESTALDAERVLDEAYHDPDPLHAARLRDQVVVGHCSLARSLAHRFDHRGVERDDLEQVAMLGLVQAARRFRPDRGGSFTAFAAPTIIGELKRYFRDHGWGIRPPRSVQELHLQVNSATRALTQELGHTPSEHQVADRVGRTVDQVREARSADDSYRAASLDAPFGGRQDLSLGDTLADDDHGYDLVEDRVALRPVLRGLSERERLVLRLRFVEERTQRQIGNRIGVSQMQVSRILSGAIERMRTELLRARSPEAVSARCRISDSAVGRRRWGDPDQVFPSRGGRAISHSAEH